MAYAGAGKNLYEASRPAILDTTAGQIAVIDICSTFENAARAGSQTERQPGRPGLNPLRFSEKYTITEKHAQDLAKIAEVTGINGLRICTGRRDLSPASRGCHGIWRENV